MTVTLGTSILNRWRELAAFVFLHMDTVQRIKRLGSIVSLSLAAGAAYFMFRGSPFVWR